MSTHKVSFLIFNILSIVIFSACNKRPVITASEEENAYGIVYELGATGKFQEAIAASDSLLENFTMSDTLRVSLMIERMVAMANSGNVDAALAYSDTLSEFSKKSGISEGVMQALEMKGVSNRRKGRFDEAKKYYAEAIELARDEGNIEMEQTLSDMMGIIYVESGHPLEALEFEQRALSLAESLADTTAMISAAASIGACYERSGQYAEAIDFLNERLNVSRQMNPVYRIKFLTPLFSSYLALDSIYAAKRCEAEMENAASGLPPYHQSAVAVLTAKSRLLAKEKKYREQWDTFCLIDSLGTHGKSPEIILTERAECLANMNDYKGAYRRMLKAYDALDSIRKSDIDAELSELAVRYDTYSKEIEIERLSMKQRTLAAIATGCLFIVIIVILIAVNMRRRQSLRMEREKHLQYLRGLEQERCRMARELHDDVAGELVGLQFGIDTLTPEERDSRIMDIARKVRTLSHELMPPQFKEQSFTSLLVDYVRRLNRQHSPDFVVLTDEGSYDWETLPPEQSHELYRITQEAVNNALRHAKPSRISITLDGNERFSLTIENDGVTKEATDSEGIGMQTLRARVEILNADISTAIQNSKFTLTITQR